MEHDGDLRNWFQVALPTRKRHSFSEYRQYEMEWTGNPRPSMIILNGEQGVRHRWIWGERAWGPLTRRRHQ